MTDNIGKLVSYWEYMEIRQSVTESIWKSDNQWLRMWGNQTTSDWEYREIRQSVIWDLQSLIGGRMNKILNSIGNLKEVLRSVTWRNSLKYMRRFSDLLHREILWDMWEGSRVIVPNLRSQASMILHDMSDIGSKKIWKTKSYSIDVWQILLLYVFKPKY